MTHGQLDPGSKVLSQPYSMPENLCRGRAGTFQIETIFLNPQSTSLDGPKVRLKDGAKKSGPGYARQAWLQLCICKIGRPP